MMTHAKSPANAKKVAQLETALAEILAQALRRGFFGTAGSPTEACGDFGPVGSPLSAHPQPASNTAA